MKTALEHACEFIMEKVHDCPGGVFDWDHPNDCDEVCHHTKEVTCWKIYFEEKAKKEDA